MPRVNVLDSTFQRDIDSRGLIETDTSKRDDYATRRKMMNMTKTQKTEINNLKHELDDLKASIAELKELLTKGVA